MAENHQPSAKIAKNEAAHFPLSTDLCIRLVTAGLCLRDLQSCTRVSRGWHKTWDLAIRESPSFFLRLFFADSDPHAGDKDREGRYREFRARMRERLTCMLGGAHLTLVPMGVPPELASSAPMERFEFEKRPLATATSLETKSFDERRVRYSFIYHDGLVAWNLDAKHFVVDDLRRKSWRRFAIVKPEGTGWNYGRPHIACMNKEMVVFRTMGRDTFVYNLTTGAVITFQYDESLTMFYEASMHAVGQSVVFLCHDSRQIIQYRMNWHTQLREEQAVKVKTIHLPHPNFSHVFFDESNDGSITIFAVSHGKKNVIVYEYNEDCSLKREYRTIFRRKDLFQDRWFELNPRCQRTDSRGNIELGFTDAHEALGKQRAACSLIFNIPSRRFFWCHAAYSSPEGTRWNNWQYNLILTPLGRTDAPGEQPEFGITVTAKQCTALSEDMLADRSKALEAKGLQRLKSLHWLEEVEYKVPQKAVELLKGAYWRSEVFVDDEFLVFSVDHREGAYGVLDIKGKNGKEFADGTIFIRGKSSCR